MKIFAVIMSTAADISSQQNTYKRTDNENIKGLTKKLVYFGWPLKKVGSVGMSFPFFLIFSTWIITY